MGTVRWRGDSARVAQVQTFTVGSSTSTQTFSVTINRKTVTYTAGVGETTTTVASGLLALLNTSTYAEFREVTWTSSTNVVTGTATTPGVPFTATAGGTGTLTSSVATASKGPNHWGDVNNWDTGALPVSTDDVYISGGASILYDLDQNTVTLNSLNIEAPFKAAIGNPDYNGSYFEYRGTFLKISATTLNVGTGSGPGSGFVRINLGTNACAASVEKTGSRTNADIPALSLAGSHASNTLRVVKGDVGLAHQPGSTANFPVITTGFLTNQQADANLYCGTGCSLTTITMNGGNVTVNTAVTTLTINAGTATTLGSGAITTLNGNTGTLYHQSSGNITTPTLGSGFTLDFSRDPRSKTVGTITRRAKSAVKDPNKVVSSLAMTFQGCSAADCPNDDFGENYTLTRS